MRSASLPALRGFATMMWQSVGSRPGMTAANSFVWPNGAPDALSRPIAYCWTSSGSIRKLDTCTVRLRTTRYVPLVIQPGPSPGFTHTFERILTESSGLRLFVPSLKPMMFLGVPPFSPGSGSRTKPYCDQRDVAAPWAAATMACSARPTTSWLVAQHCTPMSPPVSSGCSWSPLKWGMSTSAGGRCAAMPKRESNALAPRPKVIVSRPGSNSSPPALPAVRPAAAAVSDRIRSRRPALQAALRGWWPAAAWSIVRAGGGGLMFRGGGEIAFSPERRQPIHVSERRGFVGEPWVPHVKVPRVQLIVEHLPHLIPAAAGLGFLG